MKIEERHVALGAMGVLAVVLAVVTVLYATRRIESGAPILILLAGELVVIVIAVRAYGGRGGR